MPAGRGSVALVGLSGTGKSTVAPLLARHLGVASADVDREVERHLGATVAEVFAGRGEDAFRDAEAAALARLLDDGPVVVATGGGAVLRPSNRELLAARCRVVWLRADPDLLAARLAGSDEARPLVAGDPGAALRRLAAERESLYLAVADAVVDVDGLTPAEVAETVLARLGTGGGDPTPT